MISFFSWGESLGLVLNISKCVKMSYFRIDNPIVVDYTIYDIAITSFNIVRDQGIHFFSKAVPQIAYLGDLFKSI